MKKLLEKIRQAWVKLKTWLHGNTPIVTMLKYLPVIGTYFMTVHIAHLLCGIDRQLAESLCGFSVSGTLMLLLASYRFNFCKLHKALIIYTAVAQICIGLKRLGVFGVLLTPARIVMLSAGVILLVLLVIKIRKYHSYDCV